MSKQSPLQMTLLIALAMGAAIDLGCSDSDDGSPANDDGGTQGGGGKGSGPGGDAVKPGDKASADISAAKGGEVSLGGVTANIPAGALADDTTVTVEVLDASKQPAPDDIVADVFDFGPDGTKFLKPVTLELDVGELEVPTDKDAVLAYLDGDKWVALEDSKLAAGKVTATTMHFTPFTVVLVLRADGTIDQTAGGCPTDNFDACGGDLVGTWEYTAACATVPPDLLLGNGDKNPFAECTDQPQVAITVDLTGTVTFNDDGTFSNDQTTTFSSEIRLPASCVETLAMGGDAAMTCTDAFEGMVDDKGDCLKAGDPDMNAEMGKGTWTTDGGMLMVVDAPDPDAGTADGGTGSKNEELSYCVKGDVVTVLIHDLDKGFTVRYTATRKP